MAYKQLAVLVALVAVASAASITKNEESPEIIHVGDVEDIPGYVRVFEDLQPAHGVYKDFFTYEADLSTVDWDNKILSYCIRGIWMFYNNVNYNADAEDWMFWTHGIDFCDNVPSSEEMMASSFRYSGSDGELDDDSFHLYEETGFQGTELYGVDSMPDLKAMAAKAESIIISGTGNWTFYTDANYGGTAVCAGYDYTDSANNQTLHVAMITTLAQTWNRSIKSVQKGCHTTTMLEYQPLVASHQTANGASGSFKLKKH